MRIETSQARKETEVFSSNLETSKKITAIKERRLKQGKDWVEKGRPKKFKQRKTVEELRLEKQQTQEPTVVQRKKVLTNIFGKWFYLFDCSWLIYLHHSYVGCIFMAMQ